VAILEMNLPEVAVSEQNKILNDMDRCLSLQGLY